VEKLSPILADEKGLKSEFRKRNKEYETKTVSEKNAQILLDDGWVQAKKRLKKGRARFTKIKPFDKRLENKVWCLFYRMGYPEINQGHEFKIKISRKGAKDLDKQIDVFAKDDETVIVTECKSSKSLTRRSLQKDIEEFANLKGPIANSVRAHYGSGFKPKILWLFVTENIIWSSPDLERAKGQNIHVVTERELRYFRQISEHLGSAARYQFLAEFFAGQPIPELDNRKIPAIRGKLGKQSFYCFVTTPSELLKVSFVNHRALDDPEGFPTYQRLVQRSRLKKIGDFLQKGNFFPTNLLINFTAKVRFDIVQKDEKAGIHYGYMFMPNKYKSAWIIDGQHRLYGYSKLDKKLQNQNIIVVAFEKLGQFEAANLFVTINHEQKRVPRNLLDDLEGELKWGSKKPTERIGAIAARLIQTLNADVGEPFYSRVTAQGIKATDHTCLTVPGVKDGMRRSGLVGRSIMKRAIYEPGPLCGKDDPETLDRSRSALNLFFNLIKEANFERWQRGRLGLLCTNVGTHGYLRLLAALISYIGEKTGTDPREMSPQEIILAVTKYVEPCLSYVKDTGDEEFEEFFKVPFGSGGPQQYYYRLCGLINDHYSDFQPDGLDSWRASLSDEKITMADKQLKLLNAVTLEYVFIKFKDKYEEKDNLYWEYGVKDNKIKSRAYNKSLEYEPEKRLSLENYLDFIDLKNIIEHKDHWSEFKDIFDFPAPGEEGVAKRLRWMEKVNELRRIPAHSSFQRQYKAEDFDFLELVYAKLKMQLERAARKGDKSAELVIKRM